MSDTAIALTEIETAAAASALEVAGLVEPGPQDGLAEAGTLALLSPAEPAFWARFTASAEYADGAPDPLDRWSRRVIDALAEAFGATALYPFGGPPWHPFIGWAQRSGRAHVSPVGLMVHDRAGLFLSYRGALALPARLPAQARPPAPCDGCAAPCLTTCPVGQGRRPAAQSAFHMEAFAGG
ncbi:ferredoxin [Roseisalinus antarcticus]|uniref:4Fe-4S ferredoxin-type domain-containing protein n=1 Tax=Roseisalinus antarcticus TaxID=254357 RepID=A0A1Y5TRB5_9RHOB|nr:ferredoxin [Roseisalinus antarcticus]SLN67906.1 hypothetical protein ROA7023_03273 [Roseisalinus antarcticus]